MGTRGFSVIELMVVLMISSFIGMIVLRESLKAEAIKVPIASEQLKSALIKARNTARFKLKCVAVEVNTHHLRLTEYDSCDPIPTGAGATELISIDRVFSLSPFDTAQPLIFNAFGAIQGGGEATMTALTATGQIFTFAITPAIGTVTMR